jgi:uncharacterized protein YjiS (DUF1127 family)
MTATNQTLNANTHFHDATKAGSHGAVIFDHIVHTAMLWMARSSQRHHLSALSTHELKDVGISAKAAATEAAKPFWRA